MLRAQDGGQRATGLHICLSEKGGLKNLKVCLSQSNEIALEQARLEVVSQLL